MLANLKVGPRLALGFGIVLLLMLVLTGVAISRMSFIRAQLDQIVEEDAVKLNLVNAMRDLMRYQSIAIRDVVMQEDISFKKSELKRMRETTKAYRDKTAQLEPLLADTEGKAAMAKVATAEAKVKGFLDETIDQSISENTKEAGELIRSKLRPAQIEFGTALEELLVHVEARSKAVAADAGQAYRSALGLIIGIGVLAILAGIVVGYLIQRSIAYPLKRALQVAEKIAQGDLTQKIESASRDEVGQLLESMGKMQSDLCERTEKDQLVANENLRIKLALDASGSATMIADKDGNIVYMNKEQVEMFRKAEDDLRKLFPNFKADALIGKSIDMFHKNPAHQRNILSGLTTAFRATIPMGPRTFTVVAVPVTNDKGERLGTAAGWVDRSVEVAVENEVAEVVNAAAAGEFNKRIREEDKEGFFKVLAGSVNKLLNTSEVGLNEVARVLGALAKGDLTEKITNDYQGTFGKLKDDSNKTVETLTAIINQIKEASETINTASGEISQGNTDLSQRTEEQASSLEETASSMEELTSTVKQNAENARQANQLAVGASEVAVKGGSVVGQVVTTMNGISASSKKIADIIGVIDGIAFQTNILALNAAVEAARAGEQGRGFAVVATEVRNLAQRSAAAAKEIKELITDSVGKVDDGTKLVDEAGKTMEEIVSSIKRVTDIMAEITAASQEQSSGIEQVNQAITQMDEVTQQNAALVEEAAAAAESMQEQAGSLVQAVAAFRLSRDAETHKAAPRTAKVTQLPAKTQGKPAPHKQMAGARAPVPRTKAVGSDDEWQEF
jgi:methyl-accepting chemotaxis protein